MGNTHFFTRKILYLSSIFMGVLPSTTTWADTAIGTGFYLNFALGYGSATAKYHIPGVPGYQDLATHEPNLGLGIGYGWVIGCHYWGTEISATSDNAKLFNNLNAPTGTSEVTLKRYQYFTISERYGYLFTRDTLIYGRLGINGSKWILRDNQYTYPNSPTLIGSTLQVTVVPGIGIESAVHKNVYARAEYTYEFCQTATATLSGNSVNMGTLRSQAFKMGLSYKF